MNENEETITNDTEGHGGRIYRSPSDAVTAADDAEVEVADDTEGNAVNIRRAPSVEVAEDVEGHGMKHS